MARKQVGLKLDVALLERLDRVAAERGVSRTGAVEAAVLLWLEGPSLGVVRAVSSPAEQLDRSVRPRGFNVVSSAEAKAGVRPLGRGWARQES